MDRALAKAEYQLRSGAERIRQVAGDTVAKLPWLRPPVEVEHGHLLIVPQDLRTPDPSLASELASGQLGLAGALAAIDGISPFDVRPPSRAWIEALVSFEWLRDLRAANTPEARETGVRYVLDWIDRRRDGRGRTLPDDPRLTALRVLSWLQNAGFLLEGAPPTVYDKIVDSLLRQVRQLVAQAPDIIDSRTRLAVEVTLTYASLCVSEQESLVESQSVRLTDILLHHILKDGGHVSRNAGLLVDLLLDLLPLKQCFVSRNREPPAIVNEAARRITDMLRHMRLGDGGLARFNGVGATRTDLLAAVLAYDENVQRPSETLTVSRYGRLQRRQSILICDVGPPPLPELSNEAHAGCLSFELSAGTHLVIVNTGAPGPADRDWRLNARATASHSTVVVNNASSSRLLKKPDLERKLGAPPLAEPGVVEARLTSNDDGSLELSASHNGYVERFGIIHARRLRLSAQGDRLDGVDRLFDPARTASWKGRRGMTFALHFHTHPANRVRRGPEAGQALIELPNGEVWGLAGQGADIGFEESLFLASLAGPRRGVQIVFRGRASEEADIRWRLVRLRSATASPR
ncbi:MAG: heparinase II/III family protein [Hyphomicrobiaceae bacterium]